jgi:hypothetical protein
MTVALLSRRSAPERARVGGTQSTGCRAPSACPSGGAGGLPCLLLVLRSERHFEATPGVPDVEYLGVLPEP